MYHQDCSIDLNSEHLISLTSIFFSSGVRFGSSSPHDHGQEFTKARRVPLRLPTAKTPSSQPDRRSHHGSQYDNHNNNNLTSPTDHPLLSPHKPRDKRKHPSIHSSRLRISPRSTAPKPVRVSPPTPSHHALPRLPNAVIKISCPARLTVQYDSVDGSRFG